MLLQGERPTFVHAGVLDGVYMSLMMSKVIMLVALNLVDVCDEDGVLKVQECPGKEAQSLARQVLSLRCGLQKRKEHQHLNVNSGRHSLQFIVFSRE